MIKAFTFNASHFLYQKYPFVGCQCGFDGDCSKAPHLNSVPICNCDTMFSRSMDHGYLSQKEALPVMQLSYGGSYSQHSSIQYILGPLVCRGKFQINVVLVSAYLKLTY